MMRSGQNKTESCGECVRLALIGIGDVAQRDYLPELRRIANRVEMVAICGRKEGRARQVAERYGIKNWYTNYQQMLAETDADAVINLTPMQLHAEVTLSALEAGKHVYTEKPVATSMRDAVRLRDAARERGLKLVCAPSVLLFPQVRYARSLIAEGSIGEVYSASGHGLAGVPPWGGYTSDPSQYFSPGGGPAVDMGVYPLHALTGLLGPAKRVVAMTAKSQVNFTVEEGPARGKEVKIEVDDNWKMLLDLGDSRLASVVANYCVRDTRAPELEIHGLRGTVAVNLLDVSAPVEVMREGPGWEKVQVPHDREAGPDHILGVEHLVDCIERGEEPVPSVEHAIHVLEIIERAAQSSQGGRVLKLKSTFAPPSCAQK
jgi:predicted dehydrogenase